MARPCEGQNAASVEFALRNAARSPELAVFRRSSDPALEDAAASAVAARDRVVQVERRIGLRAVRARVRAAALGAQQRVAGDQARQRVRVLGERAAGRSASRTRPAWRQSAARVSRARRLERRAPPAARRPRRAARTGAASAARAPKTKHSRQRVRGQAVGAVQAGAGALADRVEAGHRRRAVEVGDDPAHAVVRGRGHRHELGRRIEARLAQRADDVGEQQPGRPRACRGRRSAARSRRIFDQIARATSSRGASSSTKRSPPASSSVAPSPRIASVTRKPSRPLMPVDRGRVELHELEVGERGAGAAREQQADAQRARRVGRALPQRGRAAGGEDDRAGVDRRARPRRRRRRSARRGPTAWRRARPR